MPFRLITGPAGHKDQHYPLDPVEAAPVEILPGWRADFVPYFYGFDDAPNRELLVFEATSGPFAGICLAWAEVEELDHNDWKLLEERVSLYQVMEGCGPPTGQFALVLLECVNGCNRPRTCSHVTASMAKAAAELRDTLHVLFLIGGTA